MLKGTLHYSLLNQGTTNHIHQSGPPPPAHGVGVPQPGTVPGHNFPQAVTPAPPSRGFMPVTNPGFVQRSSFSPAQPSSPTQPAQVQSVVAPAAPPTVQTVDTSNVPGTCNRIPKYAAVKHLVINDSQKRTQKYLIITNMLLHMLYA